MNFPGVTGSDCFRVEETISVYSNLPCQVDMDRLVFLYN